MSEKDIKKSWIDTYFDSWLKDVERAEELRRSKDYYLEAILVLSCYVGALAAARFPDRGDRDAYIKIINRYSGLKADYNKVDLLFFYQWPRSDYRRSKSRHSAPYRKIKGYSQIKKKIVRRFGDEQSINNNSKQRYINILALLKHLDPPLKGLDREAIYSTLKLFTVAEILYRYIRCYAVHEISFLLFQKRRSVNGTTRYEDGHLITGLKLIETVRNIVNNLRNECSLKNKFPWELINR